MELTTIILSLTILVLSLTVAYYFIFHNESKNHRLIKHIKPPTETVNTNTEFVSVLKAKRDKLYANNMDTTSENEDKYYELNSLKKAISEGKEELSKLESDFDYYVNWIENREELTRSMNEEIFASSDYLEHLESEIALMKAAHASALIEINELKHSINLLKNEDVVLRNRNEELRNQNARLESHILENKIITKNKYIINL